MRWLVGYKSMFEFTDIEYFSGYISINLTNRFEKFQNIKMNPPLFASFGSISLEIERMGH